MHFELRHYNPVALSAKLTLTKYFRKFEANLLTVKQRGTSRTETKKASF
jgi:hypothetical protein